MFCKECGKQISDSSSFCSNYGAVVNNSDRKMLVNHDDSSYNVICIVGLVISSISIFLDFFGLVAIIGLVVCVIGLIKAKENNEKGKILAIVGLVLGAIEILYSVINIVALQNNILY